MKSKTRYYKIGLFVMSGFLLLSVGLVLLGAGSFFKKTIRMETYFDESVQGLDVGSAVKHRGVQIGTVESIGFVRNTYGELSEDDYYKYGKYVLVRIALTDPLGMRGQDDTILQKMIQDGLRVRLTSQGLTGTAYLELDYLPPDQSKPLPIVWAPRSVYVPSAPSTITRLSANIDRFFRKLEDSNVENLAVDLDRFLISGTKAVDDAKIPELRAEAVALLGEVRKTNNSFRELLSSPETKSIPENVGGSLAKLNQTMSRIDQLLTRNQSEMEETLENLKTASRDMKELTGTAKRYPSLLLFGTAPEKSTSFSH